MAKTLGGAFIGPAVMLGAALTGCGGGSSSSPAPTPTVTLSVSGTVTAPGGTIAFNPPNTLQRMFASIFGSPVNAAISGTDIVTGATVELFEIDSSGNKVSSALATATTASDGTYTLNATQAGLAPDSKYVIEASGTSEVMGAFLTGTTVDVNPVSDATAGLVLSTVNGGSLSDVSVGEIEAIQDVIEQHVEDLDAAPTTVAEFVSGLTTAVTNSEEASNVLSSSITTGVISGSVKDGTASNAAMAGVRIVVRDYKNWVTRALTWTDAAGNFTVNVPDGNYIVGALNLGTTSTAGSEWYTSGGGAANQFDAGKVTVATGTPTDVQFVLDAGGRIHGTVNDTAGTAPLGGIHILLRDFTNDTPTSVLRTKADGTYTINLRPGTYTLAARNSTRQPFATALYNGAATGATVNGGGKDASQATPIVVAASNDFTVNFNLAAGTVLRGEISDDVVGTVGGMSLRFYKATADASNGAFVESVRTNKDGKYRMWVQADQYEIDARGQQTTVDTTTSYTLPISFTSRVGQASATIYQPDGTTPMSQVKATVYDASGNFVGREISDSDGTVTVFTDTTATGPFYIEYKVDGGSDTVGTTINGGSTNLLSGTQVSMTADSATVTAIGNVTMSAGRELTGTVTVGGVAQGNVIVQVRMGGLSGNSRLTATRTQTDGTYTISIPAGTYNRICAYVPPNAASVCPGTASPTPTAGVYNYVDGWTLDPTNANTDLDFAI